MRAIGNILKKLSGYLFAKNEKRKKILKIFCVSFLAFFLPLISVMGILNGNIEIDERELETIVINSLSKECINEIEHSEKVLNDIEEYMTDEGYDKYTISQASLVYMLLLSKESYKDDFPIKLSSCYIEENDNMRVAKLNKTFGLDISAEDYSKLMSSVKNTYIDNGIFKLADDKNNIDLVNWAVNAKNEGWGYVYGTYGNVLTSSLLDIKAKQYPQYVGENKKYISEHWLGGRTADCIGLIKGYIWYDVNSGEIKPGSNMPDIGANKLYEYAKEKGSISTIPEIPGIAVWRDGHIGIYIGNGKVIQAANTYKGVIDAELRYCDFTHWLKIPYIEYIDEEILDEN